MHDLTFLQDLAIVMIVAAIVTVLFRQLKQPVVLGYILAGVIIGPHTPPFPLIADEHAIKTLSELGVIFLMFSLGLEFSLRKLREVGATAFIAATLEILLMVCVGYELGQLFGWKQMDCIFLGAILSISSTTIIIKALEELGKTKEKFARLIFGILIVEDILAIVMIALLSGFATTGSLAVEDIGRTVLQLSAFLGVLLVGGLIAVPRLLELRREIQKQRDAARHRRRALLRRLAARGEARLQRGARRVPHRRDHRRGAADREDRGAHPSGARSVQRGLFRLHRPAHRSAGARAIRRPDPRSSPPWSSSGKVLTCSLGTFLAGHDQRTSLRVGMGLAQIGEFSFIIAALGLSLKVTSDFLYPIAVAVSALTTLCTPYLMRSSDAVVGWFDRAAPRSLTAALETYTRWVGQAAASAPARHRRPASCANGRGRSRSISSSSPPFSSPPPPCATAPSRGGRRCRAASRA